MHVTPILPQIEIARVLPSNQSEKINYVARTHEVNLINFGKAHVNAKGMVFKGLKMMRETYPMWDQYPSLYQRHKLLKSLYLKSKIYNLKSRPLLTVVDGYGATCYYHWMWDQLVRINLVKKDLGDDFMLALPDVYFVNNFCIKSLEMIGIGKDRVIVLKKRDAATSDHVFFPTWILGGGKDGTTYDSQIIQTRNDLLKYCEAYNQLKFSLGERIFISRSKQKKRIIINQEEVDKLLAKYGFAVVCMEDLSFENGISVSYNSKYTIAQCGSGLSNIIFQKAGSKILELYPKLNYDLNHAWFSEMAQAGDMHHSYQYCKIDSDNIVINEFHTDMIVDLEVLEKNIRIMIGN